jgi:hypothetical protein
MRAIKATRDAAIKIARIDVNKDGGFSIIPKDISPERDTAVMDADEWKVE